MPGLSRLAAQPQVWKRGRPCFMQQRIFWDGEPPASFLPLYVKWKFKNSENRVAVGPWSSNGLCFLKCELNFLQISSDRPQVSFCPVTMPIPPLRDQSGLSCSLLYQPSSGTQTGGADPAGRQRDASMSRTSGIQQRNGLLRIAGKKDEL